MIKAGSLFFIVSLIVSCRITKDVSNQSFIYKSENRTLELIFDSDSTCQLINTFHCSDIDLDVRELTTYCSYLKIGDKIILRNLNCKTDTCKYDLFMDIPVQKSVECDFLNEENRIQQTLSPNYSTQYKEKAAYPLIDIDTLQILKNKIVLYKQNNFESIGFVFK